MSRSFHQKTPAPGRFSPDVIEFLRALNKHEVKYIVVGGDAVIFHGHVRFTGDVDFFYSDDDKNVAALYQALLEFWRGTVPNIASPKELQEPGNIIQFGRPPNRLDLMNAIDGVSFKEAWESRIQVFFTAEESEIAISYLSKENLIKNKVASGRPKDLEDVKFLR